MAWCGVLGCRGGAWSAGLSCFRARFRLAVAAVVVVTVAGDVVAGGVLDGGEAALGAAAAGVGAAPGRRRVVVLLPGFRVHGRRDGDRLLGAAGLGVLWRGEDLGPVPVQGHRRRAERAADLARGGRAGDPVVAVGVVAG